jgi:hypothetical protein
MDDSRVVPVPSGSEVSALPAGIRLWERERLGRASIRELGPSHADDDEELTFDHVDRVRPPFIHSTVNLPPEFSEDDGHGGRRTTVTHACDLPSNRQEIPAPPTFGR